MNIQRNETQILGNVRTTIEANNRKFEQAFQRGDVAGLAALYSGNVRILPPGSEMMQGCAAIQSFWQAVMDRGVNEAKLETLDVEEGGEHLVREIGRYVLTIQQGGETVKRPGKYVVVWKQEDGNWKLDVDIWNS